MARKIQKKENIFEKILNSLDSTWTKLAIIGVIGYAGFKMGCYYQETIMTRQYNEEYFKQIDAWVRKEETYRENIQELRLKVIHLEQEIVKTKSEQ